MTGSRQRTVDVAPERLERWLAGFEQRHGGPLRWDSTPDRVIATAHDGAEADCEVPFPPMPADPANQATPAGPANPADPDPTDSAHPANPPDRTHPTDPPAALRNHALLDRRVGVLLVRLGGYAAGIFWGTELQASKVGSRPVHGRNAAGGQSQQRFARRREGQARVALAEAADVAARILLPARSDLDAVVTGGDKRAVTGVLADARLAPLRPLVVPRLLDVPDPRLRVLQTTPDLFRAVRISVTDPPAG